MSLLPVIVVDDYKRPLRLLDQHFGIPLDPEHLIVPVDLRGALRGVPGYMRTWRSAVSPDIGSNVIADKDHFQVNLDVQQFAPNEITVKSTGDDLITVEGKHEEKEDEHGLISRHFIRKYLLPKGHDINHVKSHLSSDGVLTISVPRLPDGGENHRTIPINHTGEPHPISYGANQHQQKQ